ncbi:SHOCT domain-containing protein [Solirubrobacter ginsenosidimutans]|uniref:SHOCT domain-containing protein n=1 Tax=Solirubrobacter ginsenosidimutans TaxID=490573 RepID=A0A9X3MLU2_9ACTN|nr:SHOCT domain-containing protein [Solirubrobacter ginsenosidimutans]MDA0158916.1 SHOCT domain-containing protein [Solirubrobacter ginsenosidimutans]
MEAKVGSWRRPLAMALIVAATVVAFLAILAIWLNRQALNTDNWSRTSSELLQQPVVRDQLAARLTEELYSSVDIEGELRDALPDRAKVLAAPAANALRNQVEKTARKALARPDVQALWVDANRNAHEQLLLVLDGGGKTVSTRNGVVVLDVKQLLARLQQEVGVGGRLSRVLPASASQVTLMRSNQLETAQTVLRVLKPLPVFLVVLSLVLFGAAVAVAPGWRRRALRTYGIGFVVAGAGALLARSVAGDQFVSSLARTAAAEPSIATVYSIATALLVNVAVATIAYGVVMIAGAWLAGPTGIATTVRRVAAPYWRVPWIAYSALAVVVAILVAWAPTPAWRNGPMLVILIVLLAAGVEALRRQMIREFPAASRADAARRRRERWARMTAAGRRQSASLRQTAVRTAGTATTALASSRDAVTGRATSTDEERIEQLERLGRLRAAGVLDDEELRTEKARILHDDLVGKP